jgi:hypothetical protein
MTSFLIVDVDDLLDYFRRRSITIEPREVAVGLRANAAFAAGLKPDQLRSIAVGNWSASSPYSQPGLAARFPIDLPLAFRVAGYELVEIANRAELIDRLAQQYLADEPVDELILATTDIRLVGVIDRVQVRPLTRFRVWGPENILRTSPYAERVIVQPLEGLLGIKQSMNVAIYIDFENIAISLNEQGYTVNLDALIDAFIRQGKAHGQVIKIAAYAPWGQRGSLPPMVDNSGREVTDEAQSRLAMASIDPVFNLPGKNSADMRIVRDAITDAAHDTADIIIVASGDRDFFQLINDLRARNKQVIVWAVRGAVSRQLETTAGVMIEYVEDFTSLQTHQMLSQSRQEADEGEVTAFTPSQWSSVILQMDRLSLLLGTDTISRTRLIDQLVHVNAVVSKARGEDLVQQAMAAGILRPMGSSTRVALDPTHPVVEKTRLIRDRIVLRVNNTLQVRQWEYVNYGFLLKGLAMDRELDRPGLNYSDQWRSDWIDCLVREHILLRELVPHRHNPDDLVPVIKLRPDYAATAELPAIHDTTPMVENWKGISLEELERMEPETADMIRRVIVSVEQFTSFRGFTWCPLGSLHRRLRSFDRGMSFQRSVEFLVENDAAAVREYPNPQSEFMTKGISLNLESPICHEILTTRDRFVRLLLTLYERNMVISENSMRMIDGGEPWDYPLWFSIMQTENVLNEIPGRPGQYNLFRTHHTVSLVAEAADLTRGHSTPPAQPPSDPTPPPERPVDRSRTTTTTARVVTETVSPPLPEAASTNGNGDAVANPPADPPEDSDPKPPKTRRRRTVRPKSDETS